MLTINVIFCAFTLKSLNEMILNLKIVGKIQFMLQYHHIYYFLCVIKMNVSFIAPKIQHRLDDKNGILCGLCCDINKCCNLSIKCTTV